MKTKQILLLSILIAVATPWITLHAQSGRGPLPLAPPPDAEEADMQAIPDLPDDFESSSAELGNLAGAAVEIMQLQFEAAAVGQDVVQEMQETPGGWDVIREMREAPGKHGLETDRYNMMVYHFLDGLPFNPEPQEYVTKFYLMVQGIAAEADTFIGMMPFGHYSGPPLAPPRDAEEAEMQVAANLPDDFDTNADELEAAGRVADEIAQLQDEAPERLFREAGLDPDPEELRKVVIASIPDLEPPEDMSADEVDRYAEAADAIFQAERDLMQEMREAPGNHGLETDRYNMFILFQDEIFDDHVDEEMLPEQVEIDEDMDMDEPMDEPMDEAP